MIQGTAVIVREEGIGGIYRGLVPVVSLSARARRPIASGAG